MGKGQGGRVVTPGMHVLPLLRHGKGPIGVWKNRIGKTEDGMCRRRCGVPETEEHVVFRCERHGGLRLKWIQGCETLGDIERVKEWSERAAKFFEAVTTSKRWDVG